MSRDSTEPQPLTSLDEYRLLGRSGLRVSPLCLGCMTFGESWKFGEGYEESRKVFERYYGAGGNFVDTANVYTNGESESFLGSMIGERRTELVVASKYTINPTVGLTADAKKPVRINANAGGNHRKSLVENLDSSLKRLGIGYLDILYIHMWEYRTPVEEVLRAMDDVVRSGKVLYAAISDTPAWVVSQANTIADFRGWTRFIGLQTRYNLLDRTMEGELEPMSASMGLGIVPWGVLAEGFLTGKHTREGIDTKSGRQRQVAEHASKERNWTILDTLRAATPKGKAVSATALNWMLQKSSVTSPIVGARTAAQLEDNLQALSFKLGPDAMKRLDYVSAPSEWAFPVGLAKRLGPGGWTGAKVETPSQFVQLFNLP